MAVFTPTTELLTALELSAVTRVDNSGKLLHENEGFVSVLAGIRQRQVAKTHTVELPEIRSENIPEFVV